MDDGPGIGSSLEAEQVTELVSLSIQNTKPYILL